jgi:hypothetical protein
VIEDFIARLSALDAAFVRNLGDLTRPTLAPSGRGGFALERVVELEGLAQRAKAALGSLEPTARLDVEHFLHCVELESFVQLELGERLHNPDVITPFCDGLVTTLFAPFSSESERFDRLAALVGGFPIYLAEAATTFGEPDPLWHEMAVAIAQDAPLVFDSLKGAAAGRASPKQAESFATGCAKAKAALKEFTRTLSALKTGPVRYVVGRDRFEKLIGLRRLPYDLRDLRELASDQIGKLKEKRRALCKSLGGFSDHKNALRAVQSEHPDTFEAALTELRGYCREARDFIGERALCELPSDDELQVVETPPYAQPMLPFAAMLTPKPLWPVQRSKFFITRPEHAAHLPSASLKSSAVLEGYPGHHLQRSVAHTHGSLWRNAPWASSLQAQMGADTINGWAHYCEALMKGQGFHTSVADKLQATNDSLWRAVSLELDIALALGEISLPNAAMRLIDEVGAGKDAAMREVRRAAQMPGCNLGYTVGKHLIRELRTEAERKWGRAFSLSRFHHLVMTNGQAPLSLARVRLALAT